MTQDQNMMHLFQNVRKFNAVIRGSSQKSLPIFFSRHLVTLGRKNQRQSILLEFLYVST